MKILRSKSPEHAADMAIKEISDEYKKICLTGGRFGEILTERFLANDINISSWEIFLTDERLNCSKQEQVISTLLPNLERVTGFNEITFNPFLQGDYMDSYKYIADKIKDSNFDITFLSLGEDGHLAGQFTNSKLTNDDRFCHTTNALKEPKERISFNVEHLFKSRKVILAVLGEGKRNALKNFYQGKGLFASFCNKNNLVLITDIDIFN